MDYPEFVVTMNQRGIHGSRVTVDGKNFPVQGITIEQSMDAPHAIVVLRIPIIPGMFGRIEVTDEY
jgi:hypothetical protein